jgi:hypothetical protein
MYIPAKVGLLIVAFMFLAALVEPLAVFMYEVASDPNLLSVWFGTPPTLLNSTHVSIPVTISYRGSVNLEDFKLLVGDEVIYFGDISRGNYTKDLLVPVTARISGISLSFKVAGIYTVNLTVEEVS